MTVSKVLTALTVVAAITWSAPSAASNLPRSREGTLIESTSPAEVLVKAKGIGYWEKGMSKERDLDKTLTASAEDDARKAAVWFVLFGGTDPLLPDDEARRQFSPYEEDFFASDHIRGFIAWEGAEFITRIKKPLEKDKRYELHIEKAYRVNKKLIEDYLNQKGILPTRAAVAEALGLPVIMVIPAVGKGQNPIEAMQRNPNLSHAAKVIEGYLTARRYDVVVPEQQLDLSALAAAQQSLKDVQEDLSYQLALSVGSDVYITYEVNVESDRLGTRKAVVNVRAYETTTARLLGTETGYSPSMAVSELALIENAVNDAVDKVLSRIMNYWKEDLTRGVQYKLIVSIATTFGEDQIEDITFAFSDLLAELAKRGKFKENIVTDQTLDYLVWADPKEFDKPTEFYRWLKERFESKFPAGKLKRVNLNRKLVLLKVEP